MVAKEISVKQRMEVAERLKSRLPLALIRRILRTRGASFGLVVTIIVLFTAVAAPFIAPYDPVKQDYSSVLKPPSTSHLLGTDELGRDVFSRVIYGAQVSVQAGIVSVGFAMVMGVMMGLLAGYFGSWVDSLFMGLADAMWSFPSLVLALAIGAVLGPGLINAMIAIGIVYTPVFARLVRAQSLSVREMEFVQAARVMGAGPTRLMLKHIWPNVASAVIVQSSLMVAVAIIAEAALSFLGLGVQPPQPSWGSMLKSAYQYMGRAPWLSLFPGAAIFLTVLGVNLLGDGLRRALDPRMKDFGEA